MMERLFLIALLFISAPATSSGFFQNGVSKKARTRPSPPRGGSEGSSTELKLQQFAPAASKLFSNMITPASILAGAMVPIGFVAPLAFRVTENESKLATILRRLYPFLCVMTLTSQLVSIMWASVAVNQLAESPVEMAESVWHLLQRDMALPWAAVNSHFVVGMLGFMCVIGTRAFFMAEQGLAGKCAAGLAISGLASMTSVVNRGVASGGGFPSQRYGSSVLALFRAYITLLIKRSVQNFGLLELTGAGLAVASIVGTLKFLVGEIKDIATDKVDKATSGLGPGQ
jgi:hypothetical protein